MRARPDADAAGRDGTTVGIVSVGTYIPETFITAAEIAELSGIPEEVVAHKMGIVRKPIPGPADHTNAMGLWAAEDALAGSPVKPDEIDLVLCTTEEWKEYPLWTAGIKLAHDLGARRAWAIDVQMRCATTTRVGRWGMDSNAFWMRVSVSTSTALVLSSRIRMAGRAASARAMAMRCFCPPERLAPRSSTRDSYPWGCRRMNSWA